MTVGPNTALDAQMAMFETASEGVSSQDAKIVFHFVVGEINVRMYGRFIISDALMSKIKGIANKIRDLWLMADFAVKAEQSKYKRVPMDYQEEDTKEADNVAAFDGFFADDDGGE